MMPLSRTCNLADFPDCLTVAAWQQALARIAWEAWIEAQHVRTRAPSLCVNWSGCPFEAPGPAAIYLFRGQGDNGGENGISGMRIPAVYGLSVVDHVDAPVRFLNGAAAVLREQGLLFLTFAFWNAEGPDVAAGNDQRRRIYDLTSWKKLIGEARRIGFQPFGGCDWTYHGHTLEDHSLASLVLIRRS
jgi:hypothetical protein